MKKYAGFTLIELMVTTALMVIVLAVGVPSFFSIIQNNRLAAATNDLTSALHLARNEAIKRGTSVSVCAAGNQNFTACGTSGDWGDGWMVFTNPNEDGTFANNATEVLIKVREQLDNTNVTPGTAVNRATFNSAGFPAAGTGGLTFAVANSGCIGTNLRTLTISNTGRITVALTDC